MTARRAGASSARRRGRGRARRGATVRASTPRLAVRPYVPMPSSSSVSSATASFPARASLVQHVLQQAAVASARPLGDDEVLTGSHAGEHLDPLERSSHPETGLLVRRQPAEVLPVERDCPLVRLDDAEQAVEQRRLARAVRPTSRPTSPASTNSDTSVNALMPPNRTVYVTNVEHGFAALAHSLAPRGLSAGAEGAPRPAPGSSPAPNPANQPRIQTSLWPPCRFGVLDDALDAA